MFDLLKSRGSLNAKTTAVNGGFAKLKHTRDMKKSGPLMERHYIPVKHFEKHAEWLGKKFTRYTVLSILGIYRCEVYYKYRCDCGEVRDVSKHNLRTGNSASCGCLKYEKLRKSTTTHGKRHSLEYVVWCNMKARCFNPRGSGYKNYGGRGITVCDRWAESFEDFYNDMGPTPFPGYEIDRIDSNGNYEPGNCRWVTEIQQARNSRNNVLVTIDGQTKCLAEWAQEKNLKYFTICKRISRYGWNPQEAVLTPMLKPHDRRDSRVS